MNSAVSTSFAKFARFATFAELEQHNQFVSNYVCSQNSIEPFNAQTFIHARNEFTSKIFTGKENRYGYKSSGTGRVFRTCLINSDAHQVLCFNLKVSSGTAGVWVINLVSNWPESRGCLQEFCIIDQILNPLLCSVFVPSLQEL